MVKHQATACEGCIVGGDLTQYCSVKTEGAVAPLPQRVRGLTEQCECRNPGGCPAYGAIANHQRSRRRHRRDGSEPASGSRHARRSVAGYAKAARFVGREASQVAAHQPVGFGMTGGVRALVNRYSRAGSRFSVSGHRSTKVAREFIVRDAFGP